MEYVGIDYHTRYAIATRMDKEGTVFSQDRIPNTREDIRDYFGSLPSGSEVVLEATNNWSAFVEWTEDLPLMVKLANPARTKAIAFARIKTDSLDSKVLADLLRSNFIAESYLAPQSTRDIRELVRYRTTLVRLRAQLKTRIRSVLFKVGEILPETNVLGIRGRKTLANLEIRPIYQEEIQSCLQLADSLTKQIRLFEEKIRDQAVLDENIKLLMTIPGISFFSGLLITSEIGDYQRFPSSRKLCAWAGLVPSVYASGGKIRRGRITKQGSKNLRFALLQAVPHVIRKHAGLYCHYNRIKKKHGNRIARIAVARKLLGIILSMLKTKTPFRQEGKTV